MSVPATSSDAERVRHLVRLDARQVVERFNARQGEMIGLFSKLRDREALTLPVHSLLPTLRFADLVVLEPNEQDAVTKFMAVVEELRWYLGYTEHMPGALSDALESYGRALSLAHDELVTSLAISELVREPHDASVRKPAAKKKTTAKKTSAKKTSAKKAAAKKAPAKKTSKR